MSFFRGFICVFYGIISIAQTLNSRFLFRTLQFNFYSTVFMAQRIFIVLLSRKMNKKSAIKKEELIYILPYSFIMSSINILSSYCVTVMPLAAFMAFKKFVIFFVLVVGIVMQLPNNFSKKHYGCILCILVGGLMIGENDIFKGQFIGYIASLVYTLFEALSLQYALHLYEKNIYGPQQLMVANSLLSLPYYIILISWEGEVNGIIQFCSSPLNPLLFPSILLAILLAFSSEYTALTISMKISPFQKASVSNIKDLLLTMISIHYFKDLEMTTFSQIGLSLCLSASLIFSFTLIKSEQTFKQEKHYQKIGEESLTDLSENQIVQETDTIVH